MKLDDIFVVRGILLFECEGHFHQVMITREQYEKVMDIVSPDVPDSEKNTIDYIEAAMSCGEGVTLKQAPLLRADWKLDGDLFLGISEFYPKHEIRQHQDRWNELEQKEDDLV